jgi:hypothetical protein
VGTASIQSAAVVGTRRRPSFAHRRRPLIDSTPTSARLPTPGLNDLLAVRNSHGGTDANQRTVGNSCFRRRGARRPRQHVQSDAGGVLRRLGLDFVWLDLEHGGPGPDDGTQVENLLRAADAAGIEPLVRSPKPDPSLIRKALDAGVPLGGLGFGMDDVNQKADAGYQILNLGSTTSAVKQTVTGWLDGYEG